MAEEAKKGPLEQAAEGAVKGAREAVEGAVQGAREAVQEVQEALGGAVETAADVAAQTAAHSNLTGIAVVVLAALVCGMAMERLRQPALVGYILAGVLLGPSALAVVESREQIDVLAELGVLMLLFIVGMELSLRSFRKIWGFALLVTGFQIGASVGIMLLLSMAFGWSTGLAVLLGFVVALSSTAVAIKILDSIGELRSRSGRITVAVLIAQDLAVVPMMLGIGAAGGDGFDWIAVPKIALSVAFLVALILYLSRGRKISLPFAAMVAGNADLKPLAAVAFCVGCAAVTGLLGLSAAYGAFIAGLIIGNSRERHAMLEATRPIQSILMMVFFLPVHRAADRPRLYLVQFRHRAAVVPDGVGVQDGAQRRVFGAHRPTLAPGLRRRHRLGPNRRVFVPVVGSRGRGRRHQRRRPPPGRRGDGVEPGAVSVVGDHRPAFGRLGQTRHHVGDGIVEIGLRAGNRIRRRDLGQGVVEDHVGISGGGVVAPPPA